MKLFHHTGAKVTAQKVIVSDLGSSAPTVAIYYLSNQAPEGDGGIFKLTHEDFEAGGESLEEKLHAAVFGRHGLDLPPPPEPEPEPEPENSPEEGQAGTIVEEE